MSNQTLETDQCDNADFQKPENSNEDVATTSSLTNVDKVSRSKEKPNNEDDQIDETKNNSTNLRCR